MVQASFLPRTLLGVALFLWALLLISYWNYDGLPPTDGYAYHLAANRIRQGRPLYTEVVDAPHSYENIALPYLYPPPFAAVLSLGPERFQSQYRLLLMIGAAGVALLALGLSRLACGSRRWAGGIAAGLMIFLPVPESIITGNIQALIDGVVAIALTLSPFTAALLICSTAMIKVTPVWALLVVVTRSRSGMIGGVVAAGAAAVITWSILGTDRSVDAWRAWIYDVAPTLSQGQFDGGSWWAWNLSPTFAPLRLILREWPAETPLPGLARLYLALISIVSPLVVMYLTRRLPWNEQAALVLVTASLAAPILRPSYLSILLIGSAVLYRWRLRNPVVGRGRTNTR